ncbi:MAG: hypothetical protein V3U98_03835 [Acidobacteriota bacterium]
MQTAPSPRLNGIIILAAALMVVAAASTPVAAEIDFAASLSIPLGDDGRVFINVASNYYHADPDVVVYASKSLHDPVGDLAVALFIAKHARRSPRAVIDLRLGGKGWLEIFASYGLPYSLLFADLPPNPGPPYGKAWGHWKKHKQNPASRILLSDAEFADLVHLRVTIRALGLDAHQAVAQRSKGKPFHAIAGNAYRAKHGGKAGGKGSGKQPKGPGKGKPKAKGKPGNR